MHKTFELCDRHIIEHDFQVLGQIALKFNEVETVNRFCYLGDRLNASGGCEAAVTARVRIGWVRFRECGELLLGNRFPLKMKGKVYGCCNISNTVWK